MHLLLVRNILEEESIVPFAYLIQTSAADNQNNNFWTVQK
jgi:hypothetical protein